MPIFKFIIPIVAIMLLSGCNKDEEIFIQNPENDPSDGLSQTLGYSVVEYLPAPGQFINESVSGFDSITSMKEACRQAEKRFAQRQYVSLGAWGGHIIIKSNKPVMNNSGYDFSIAGNSFDSSNEPGIVWVMADSNNNGLPDDQWYELRGSYYGKEGYQRNYSVTYFRPQPQKDTYWEDSDGDSGYILWLGRFHSQDFYYPQWVEEDKYTLYGSKLPAQAVQDPLTGIWSNLPFEWGYVDNNGSDMSEITFDNILFNVNNFRISDAVDKNGESVNLNHIDFIKIQTAINNKTDILGENSTEILFISL